MATQPHAPRSGRAERVRGRGHLPGGLSADPVRRRRASARRPTGADCAERGAGDRAAPRRRAASQPTARAIARGTVHATVSARAAAAPTPRRRRRPGGARRRRGRTRTGRTPARARVGAAAWGQRRGPGRPHRLGDDHPVDAAVPVRDIAGLPAQVVQRQSAQVDIVSRATYSSQAFRGAVCQALSKAA